MKIFIGADHGGYEWKNKLIPILVKKGHDVEDCGAFEHDPDDDYPQFAQAVSLKVIGSDDEDPRGIVICRGGQGVGIASNRHAGIRAAVVWSKEEASKAREHNDSNVLCLPADHLDWEYAEDIVDTWLTTEFTNEERHVRRLKQIDDFYPNA